MREYRAVFSYPDSYLGKTADTYGPPRASLEAAQADRPPRSEETHGRRSGFQSREVSEWLAVEEERGAHTHGKAPERDINGTCGCCKRRTVDPFNRSCRGCCPDCHRINGRAHA